MTLEQKAEAYAKAHNGELDLPRHERLNIYQMALRDGYLAGAREGIEMAAKHVEEYWQPPYASDLDQFVFGEVDAPSAKMARHLTKQIPETIRKLGEEEKKG